MEYPIVTHISVAEEQLKVLGQRFNAPEKVVERAIEFFNDTCSINCNSIIRVKRISSRIMACLYLAWREYGESPSLVEMLRRSGLMEYQKEIQRAFRVMMQAWNIHVKANDVYTICQRLGEELELPERVIYQSKQILMYETFNGRSPLSNAAAAVYISANVNQINISQDTISDAAGVSSTSLRNAWQALRKNDKVVRYINNKEKPLDAILTMPKHS